MNIYLLGMRGVGKTTLGKIVAEKMHCQFLDMDFLLEKEHSLAPSQWIAKYGEAAFREKEADLLLQLEQKCTVASIIATGGGVVDGARSREILRQSPNKKLYLHAQPESIWGKLSLHPDRLLVGAIQSFTQFETLFMQRKKHFDTLHSGIISLSGSLEQDALSIENYCIKNG